MSYCEWDPIGNHPATKNSEHKELAVWSVGYKGEWHLCESCAELPVFRKYSSRRRIDKKLKEK